MGNKNMDEPCKGDTPAQPRAQALGKSMNHIYEPQRGGTIKMQSQYSRCKCRIMQ